MKTRHNISLVALLALAGAFFVSCAKGPEEHSVPPTPVPEGTGYFTFGISLDNPAVTRADGTDAGLAGESSLNSMRIIFYNGAGVAVLVEDFEVYENYDHLYIDYSDYTKRGEICFGSDNTVPIPPGGIADIVIRRNPIELPVQDYQIAVLFNHEFGAPQAKEGNMNLRESTETAGHVRSILQTPMNFHDYWISYWDNYPYPWGPGFDYPNQEAYYIFTNSFMSLIGGHIQNSDYLGGFSTDYLHIFMSNADGFASVGADQLKNTTPAAPFTLPDPIRVDRAVAKVVLYKGSGVNDSQVNDLTWVPDILNFSMYPIRVPDKVAPAFASSGDAEGKELPVTNRAYRYAKDPNWDGYSRLRGTSWREPEKEFMYITSDRITDIKSDYANDVFEKTWNESKPAYKDNWYYIPENTMTANEQWEDVTTRALIRCNYVPPTSMTIGGSQIEEYTSYYAFQGKAIPVEQFLDYLADPESLPAELDDLRPALRDASAGETLAPGGSEPEESLSAYGVSFYKDGVNFYAIPIRHFDDAKSPAPMGYGRYGIVRNNVYNITIDGFYGPGSPLIPAPEGPDDKDSNIRASVKVVDWKRQHLGFEF